MTALEQLLDPFIRCSKCHTAYVLRRSLSMSAGWLWLWAPDCQTKTCKKNPPELVEADGEITPTNEPETSTT